MERVNLGTITKPQALKGAFRVKPNILDKRLFKKLSIVYINNVAYKIESIVLRDTFLILKVEGIDTCEQAETLRNVSVFGDIEIETSNNFELVDFQVLVGDNLGKVERVDNFGSKDIMTINFEKNCMVPVIDGLIENVDVQNKTITFNKEIFEQVAVYED